jgi:hypothetical protein
MNQGLEGWITWIINAKTVSFLLDLNFQGLESWITWIAIF